MQTSPNKPEVFAGWQDFFPPINLNFTTPILSFVRNSTIFIEYLNTLWFTANRFPSRSIMHLSDAHAVVCRKAYFKSYDRFRLLTASSTPSKFGLK